jgi:Winged helix DNA-binding domain
MSITARRLNRATLGRQLLLRREPLDVADAVRRVVALQAQSAASPYLALWNRLAGFDPAGLDAAFADQTVVKATLMRITLHAVRAEDYPAFHNAMLSSLRASRLNDRRYTITGLTHADADRLAPQLLEFADRCCTPRPGPLVVRSRSSFVAAGGGWGAGGVPGRPRTDGLPPLQPLVGQAAARGGSGAAWLGPGRTQWVAA